MRGQIPVQEAPADNQEARRVEVRQAAPEQRQDMSKYREQKQDLNDPNQQAAARQDTREQPKREPIRAEKTIGRNDPCNEIRKAPNGKKLFGAFFIMQKNNIFVL